MEGILFIVPLFELFSRLVNFQTKKQGLQHRKCKFTSFLTAEVHVDMANQHREEASLSRLSVRSLSFFHCG